MKKILTTLSPYAERFGRIALWFTLALAVLVILIQMPIAITHPYALDYGEGPLLDQAVRIHQGINIYQPDLSVPPYTVSNYPPVYAAILSLFNSPEQASLLPGRLLSALATLASAYCIFRIVLCAYNDRLAGLVSAILFLTFPYVFQWSTLMRVDNLALAFSLGALLVIVRWPEKTISLWATAVLLTLAAYTRQSYLLAAPLAAFVWLLFRSWKKALWLALITTGLVAALFGALMLLSQGGFFTHIVRANVNDFTWQTINNYVRQLSSDYLILSLISGVFLLAGWKAIPHWKLLGPYLAGALLSALTVGKIGSNVNYLLELCAAMSMAAGIVFSWVRQKDKTVLRWLNNETALRLASALVMLLVIAQMRSMLVIDLLYKVQEVKWRVEAVDVLDDFSTSIRRDDGQILVDEYMALLPQNGKALYIQPFEFSQMAKDGLWDQTNFVKQIENQEFSQIILHQYDYPVYRERWTPEMLDAIMANYAARDNYADSIVFTPLAEGEADARSVLDCAPDTGWISPTSGELGVTWFTRQMFIYGENVYGQNPVYAAADGLLYRFEGWRGAVAIQHDDPLHAGQKVWSFYGSMVNPWTGEETVADAFARGAEAVPVRQGDLLGYQGSVPAGQPDRAHLHFAIVPSAEDGSFLTEWLGLADDFQAYFPGYSDFDEKMLYAPGDYLNITADSSAGVFVWKPFRCAADGDQEVKK